MRVVGYTRLSVERDGYGLDVQEQAIREACQGDELVELFRDDGFSGRNTDRPGLRAALDTIERGEAEALMVAKLDRLTRSIVDFGELLEWAESHGARLIVLDMNLDTSTPMGEAMANMAVVFAQFERRMIGQRTKEALAQARARGRRISRPSVADHPELRDRILAMREGGMTLQQIADALNDEGIPTLRGGKLWRPSSVQSACGYQRKTRAKRLAL